ncbi:hypothetical protein GCM10009117_24180 [Gangjinia marincola]|uniref:Uncharacterized protein n=1 Tax=Gangjinia marincola TaxID=578463 RepID=A0ABN1MK34_9FLAO
MKRILLICTLAIFSVASAQNTSKEGKKVLENLSGTYVDPQGVDWGQGTFGKREFTFDDGKWSLTFTLAFDPQMKNPIFNFRTVGTYTVLDKSKFVEGAYNALFIEDKKFVTLKTDIPDVTQGFGFSNCDLTKDVEKDISKSGCSLWKSVAECSEDHDLLKLDDEGKLYFGVRPPDNDMCTADKRPTALTSAVVKL